MCRIYSTDPAILISTRDFVENEIKAVRENGSEVDTVGLLLLMNCYLMCLCGVRHRSYIPEMRTVNYSDCILSVFLPNRVLVFMTVKLENVQYFLENKSAMLALMRCHVDAMRDCRQETVS